MVALNKLLIHGISDDDNGKRYECCVDVLERGEDDYFFDQPM